MWQCCTVPQQSPAATTATTRECYISPYVSSANGWSSRIVLTALMLLVGRIKIWWNTAAHTGFFGCGVRADVHVVVIL
jgi:hypothetical protein